LCIDVACALALHADTRQQQFDAALASRDVIGQAKGMLMQEYTIDANAAFEMIRRISQDSNTKLVDLARRIVASAQATSIHNGSRDVISPTGPDGD